MDGGLDAVRLEVPDELLVELEQFMEPLQMVSHRQFRFQRGTKKQVVAIGHEPRPDVLMDRQGPYAGPGDSG